MGDTQVGWGLDWAGLGVKVHFGEYLRNKPHVTLHGEAKLFPQIKGLQVPQVGP